MSNVWVQFEKLFPQKKQFVGKVLSIDNTAGTSKVQLLNSSVLNVFGTSVAVDDYCLIENNKIVSNLPALTAYSATIY